MEASPLEGGGPNQGSLLYLPKLGELKSSNTGESFAQATINLSEVESTRFQSHCSARILG